MKKKLQLLVLTACLGLGSLSYANDSTLTVQNNAHDINVEIKTDLLCGKVAGGLGPGSSRYTTPLAENPIKANQPIIATWKNCAIVEKIFFGDIGDHSKIYVKIRDLKTGDYVKTILQVQRGCITKTINFTNRNFVISMTHDGDYWYRGPYAGVNATQTLITVTG